MEEAAGLRLLLCPWQQDVDFKNKGGQILYAVDTSTLQLFIAPDRDKPNLFFVDDEDELTSFTTVLADFIFFSLQEAPLLVIPPHDAEMATVFEAIASHTDNGIPELAEKTKDVLGNMEGKPHDQVITALIEKVPAIVEMLSDSDRPGPMRELRRYRHLFQQGRLRHISRDKSLPYPDRDHREKIKQKIWKQIDSRAKEWYGRLNATKPADTTKINVTRDARVLGYIEWLNEVIASSRRAVHLIAFDASMMQAADERVTNDHQHFVRDPRYFLMMNWQGIDRSTGDIAAWIDEAMLALCPGEKHYPVWLKEVKYGKHQYISDDKARRTINQLSSRLAFYLRESCLKYVLHVPRSESHKHEISRYLYENRASLEGALMERIRETVQEIDRLAVVAGFYLVAEGDPMFRKVLDKLVSARLHLSTVSRAPVWFRLFSIDDWARQLRDAIAGRGDLSVVAAAFNWPSSNLRKQYEVRVMQAYLLSLLGNWRAAENLSRRAKAIADYGGAEEEIFGHEAAYFRAVCLRHLAVTVKDLRRAGEELADAKRRSRKRIPGARDARFYIEEQVQEFAVWEIEYHETLAQKRSVPEGAVDKLGRTMGRLWALRPQVKEEQDDSIRQHIALQLLVNVVEGVLIEQKLLKTPASIQNTEICEWKKWLGNDAIGIYSQAPLFVRLMLTLFRWNTEPRNSAQREQLAQDALQEVRSYLRRELMRYERATLSLFLHELNAELGL